MIPFLETTQQWQQSSNKEMSKNKMFLITISVMFLFALLIVFILIQRPHMVNLITTYDASRLQDIKTLLHQNNIHCKQAGQFTLRIRRSDLKEAMSVLVDRELLVYREGFLSISEPLPIFRENEESSAISESQ